MVDKHANKENRYLNTDNALPKESLNKFEELIGEKVDPILRYEHDSRARVVRVYMARSRRFRVFWTLGELILMLGFAAVMVFAVLPAIKDYFLWSNIGNDFLILYSLAFVLINVIAKKIKCLFFKQELLYEIQVDKRKYKEYKRSNRRVERLIAIFFASVCLFFMVSRMYSLTYLRFLADGGYGENITMVRGEIGNLDFDNSTAEIAGEIIGTPGDMEQIRVYLQVEKCPDAVSVYINGEEVDNIDSHYVRFSGNFYDRSYFENVILADVGFLAQEINTLEIKAGNYRREWTFKVKVAGQ